MVLKPPISTQYRSHHSFWKKREQLGVVNLRFSGGVKNNRGAATRQWLLIQSVLFHFHRVQSIKASHKCMLQFTIACDKRNKHHMVMIAYSASRKYTHTLGSLYTNICTSICICTCICGTYIHTVAFLRCVFTNINHLISYSYSRSSKDSLNGLRLCQRFEQYPKESVFTT